MNRAFQIDTLKFLHQPHKRAILKQRESLASHEQQHRYINFLQHSRYLSPRQLRQDILSETRFNTDTYRRTLFGTP